MANTFFVGDGQWLVHNTCVLAPLTAKQQDALRAQARSDYDRVNPGRRQIEDLQIHHRIPLEWAHVYPNANPNRFANRVGLPVNVHRQVNSRWAAFRKGLGGRMPTSSEVMEFALKIDWEFGIYYR